MDDIEKLEALKQRLIELNDAGAAIQNKADTEKRDLTTDERRELDALHTEFTDVDADIERRERIVNQSVKLSKPGVRQTQADDLPTNRDEGQQQRQPAGQRQRQGNGLQNTHLRTQEERQRWGFESAGSFYMAVKNMALSPTNPDPRLIANAALSTYGAEGVAADGGVAVPPEWRGTIMSKVAPENGMLSRCDNQPISGNSITFPVDETTAWQTTGGIQAYWDSEAAAMTQSKPKLQDLTVKTHRLTALVPVTEELLEDAPAMSNYVTGKAGDKLQFKVNDAIVNGTGVGQPLGIMSAPCKVSVAKETSQTAATIHGRNVTKMVARMPSSSFGNSVWLANQDCLPQILQLALDVTTASGTAAGAGMLYQPPVTTGIAGLSPYGLIMGRPVIITEACATVGTEGDFILADLGQYLAVMKGALRSDVSIHLWFDQNATAFRFVLRMNGQPWLSAPIARKSGSNTLSHFVTLQVR